MDDNLSADQLVQEVLAYFQPNRPKQKKSIKPQPEDSILPKEMIEELKTLREQQKTPSQQRYVGSARASKIN